MEQSCGNLVEQNCGNLVGTLEQSCGNLGGTLWNKVVGTLGTLQEPCRNLGKLVGTWREPWKLVGTLWEPGGMSLGAAPACSKTFTMAEDPKARCCWARIIGHWQKSRQCSALQHNPAEYTAPLKMNTTAQDRDCGVVYLLEGILFERCANG